MRHEVPGLAEFLAVPSVYVDLQARSNGSAVVVARDVTRRYGEGTYRVVQLIYPTTRGAWPWQKAASDAFRQGQPLLGRKRPDRP